jgi:CelD/BcsL family acetyltransferase involved in cellulose biosynthesis
VEHFEPKATDEADVAQALDAAIAVSARSWKTCTGNSLDRPGPGDFIRALSTAAQRRGWLSIWLAYVDDKPVAMEYQLVDDVNVYALRSDFDAALDQASPGSFLFRHLLERLFATSRQQYRMGPGDNAYKLRWSTEGHELRRIIAYNRTARGLVAYLVEARAKPMLRSVRDRLLRMRRTAGASAVRGRGTSSAVDQ